MVSCAPFAVYWVFSMKMWVGLRALVPTTPRPTNVVRRDGFLGEA
jgi:hypothetical protein